MKFSKPSDRTWIEQPGKSLILELRELKKAPVHAGSGYWASKPPHTFRVRAVMTASILLHVRFFPFPESFWGVASQVEWH
jgi:hypothetical protein